MLKNKAQIAQTTLELPGPLGGPWTPASAKSEFGSALVMHARAGT